jgi:hypothetical protein
VGQVQGRIVVSAFNITDNAFALLSVTPRANRSELEDAYQDAIFSADDHEAEAALNRAQQALISPRDRLENELTFLVEAKPATIKGVVAKLKQNARDLPLQELAGLDLINLLAHLCGKGEPSERLEHAEQLIAAYETWNVDATADALNASRSVSGFGPVDPSQFKAAVNRLRSAHARAALDAILADASGIDHLASLADNISSTSPTGRVVMEAMLAEYETRIAPELGSAADKVRRSLAAVDARPDDQDAFEQLAIDLRAWDRMAQPLQNADRARGIDEHHSKELFQEIRGVCLSLGNDRQLFAEALAISKLASDVFSELPDAAQRLEDDIAALSDLTSQKAIADILSPLVTAVGNANSKHAAISAALKKGGFSASSPSPLGEIVTEFTKLMHGSPDAEVRRIAVNLVRGLGIDLCNESDDNEAALAIINGLLADRSLLSADDISRLEVDRTTTQGNIDAAKMTKALEAGKLDLADGLAERLLENASSEYRQTLLQIRSNIAQRKAEKRRNLIGWGVIGALIVGIAFLNDKPRTRTSYDPSAQTPYTDYAYPNETSQSDPLGIFSGTPTNGSDAAAVDETADAAADQAVQADPYADGSQAETPPTAYLTNPALSLPELRYCMRQSARLDAVKGDQMSSTQIDRFNEAVTDYNSRCSSFRYRNSDMRIVDTEITSDQGSIRAEGLNIIGSY